MDLQAKLGEALLGKISDAIVASDRDGRISFWNPPAERIFGRAIGGIHASHARRKPLRPRRPPLGPRLAEGRHPAIDRIEFTIVPLKDEAGGMAGLDATA
jgi:PAS domain-containing protein